MNAQVDNASRALPSALSLPARSLFSKLTSSLKRSRTRNLSDFHIRPLEPHRQYAPGDIVKGAVVLTVVKPIRITHLTVCLHGFVRVYKHANAANEPIPFSDNGLNAANGRRKSQYYGNGHASLFQDEVTLCGEGRLESGIYEFNFDLEFPGEGLPTSIDFERGTISYMITSTITRPTSIAATSSCDTKVSLVETVDVGPLAQPKPRVISLEPISKRNKRKTTITSKGKDDRPRDARREGSSSDTSPHSRSSIQGAAISARQSLETFAAPQSPTPSDVLSSVSAESIVSNGTTGLSLRLGSSPATLKSPRSSAGTGERTILKEKTITTTVELLRSGCLPGDNLTVKLTVQHSKAIKSLHGVIVTFYRQGRIDIAPPLSLFADLDGKAAEKLKHNEYYPKSKTGLGGLSLTSAGSSSVFRKDLSQTFAPLIVDPTTLTAIVNASIRVPEDVFPTITGVPGAMISFKYYIEVVVDLGGRLAGQQRHLPRIGTMPVPISHGSSRKDGPSNMLSAWGGSTVDTDHIRREKSVVACAFEVTIGTKDSGRKRLKINEATARDEHMNGIPETDLHHYRVAHEQQTGDQPDHQKLDETHNPQSYQSYYQYESYPHESLEDDSHHPRPPLHALTPQPDVSAYDEIDEKEKARRAEARLLPSEPPAASSDGYTSLAPDVPIPSAPFMHNEFESDDPSAVAGAFPYETQVEVPRRQSLYQTRASAAPITSIEGSCPNLAIVYPHDNKEDLERRRLFAEISAPIEADETEESSGSVVTRLEPSVPTLSEEDEYGHGYAHPQDVRLSRTRENESLPRYER